MPMATPLSLAFAPTMSSARRYLPPRLREPLAPRSGSVHFRLGRPCFSCLKTFQCD
jgi:hypothetical protein